MGRSKKTAYGRVRKNTKKSAEDVDFDTLVRQEFLKLNRQNRLMEDERRGIVGQSGRLSRQGRMLEQLQAEKESLLTDIKNATSPKLRLQDEKSLRTIKEALERYEKYKSDITSCLLSMAEMEANVDRITQRLVEQKLKVQSLYGQSMSVPVAEHRKRVLENRLYLATTQFDTLVSKNKELKYEINMMLLLRGNFYRRLLNIKKLSVKVKRRMADVVLEAKIAYDGRDEGASKINLLRDRNDRDSKLHILEIKEFQRVLHHDSKTHEFLAIKNKERLRMEEGEQRIERRQRERIEAIQKLVEAYKRAFKAILRMGKAANMDALVKTYLAEEEKNFGFFKVITKLNKESTALHDDIVKTKQENEQISRKNRRAARYQENSLMLEEQELEEESKKLEDLKEFNAEVVDQMKMFGQLIDEACTVSGASSAGIIESLGKQTELNIQNIPACLTVLRQTVQDLILERNVLDLRIKVELEGQAVPASKPPSQKTEGSAGPMKPSVHIMGGRADAGGEDDGGDSKSWVGDPVYWVDMLSNLNDQKQAEMGIGAPQLALEEQGSYTHFTLSKISIGEGPSTFFPPQAEEPELELVPISPPPPFTTPPPKRTVEYVPEEPAPIPRPSQQVDAEEEEENEALLMMFRPSVLPDISSEEEGDEDEEASEEMETASEGESHPEVPPPEVAPGDESEEDTEEEQEEE